MPGAFFTWQVWPRCTWKRSGFKLRKPSFSCVVQVPAIMASCFFFRSFPSRTEHGGLSRTRLRSSPLVGMAINCSLSGESAYAGQAKPEDESNWEDLPSVQRTCFQPPSASLYSVFWQEGGTCPSRPQQQGGTLKAWSCAKTKNCEIDYEKVSCFDQNAPS